ncbi:MAG: hypothetical protein C5S52_05925 [ANME-2 cluster archaeon]|nr:hypothetical protein [ANME-2 cluster archaeon]
MIASSDGIKSSSSNSSCASSISVLLWSAYFSFIARSSSFIRSRTFCGFASTSLRNAIVSSSDAYSSSSFSRSMPVRRRSCISRIAFACTSDSPKFAIKPSLAASAVFDDRISLITASMLSRAIFSPSRMCIRSSAFLRSYLLLRMIISFLWSI